MLWMRDAWGNPSINPFCAICCHAWARVGSDSGLLFQHEGWSVILFAQNVSLMVDSSSDNSAVVVAASSLALWPDLFDITTVISSSSSS